MDNKSYTTKVELHERPEDVFNCINDVQKWWSRDFEGSSTVLNDEFVIHHPGSHYSKQKLIEVNPGVKIVWLVTESTLNWLKGNKDEWTNTRMIFEISGDTEKTILQFTHEGLVPGKECYSRCTDGWNFVINDRLFNYISNNKNL